MVPDAYHDFFVATASAAGALIGLLFVALSVWQGRELRGPLAESHQLRASAALTVFTNALVVSLFALVPDNGLGEPTTILAAIGLTFILASSLRLMRVHREHGVIRMRDAVFLAGGLVLFIAELLGGLSLWIHPHDRGRVEAVAEVLIFCFLFGIARSWELIGGPQIGVVGEVSAMLRGSGVAADAPPPTPPADASEAAVGSAAPGSDASGPAETAAPDHAETATSAPAAAAPPAPDPAER